MIMPSVSNRALIRYLLGIVLLLAVAFAWLLVVRLGEHDPRRHASSARTAITQAPRTPTLPPYRFPNGGTTLFPAYRFVALYGAPDMPALGALGEQPLAETLARIKAIAAEYQPLTHEYMWPTLEIISTIASSEPTENGDYSRELPAAQLLPWVDAARQAGVYVVLDLQPGRADFLSQAKEYEPLLKQPNVGLALDPEWRLKPDQVHLQQIGSVDVSEVNATSDWLANLAKTNHLPQKLFLLHQFRMDMIANRDQLNTAHPELAFAIQMDGNGAQPTKNDTWNTIRAQPPANVTFGWKNFYREDKPMLTPEQTIQIAPTPAYISYQ